MMTTETNDNSGGTGYPMIYTPLFPNAGKFGAISIILEAVVRELDPDGLATDDAVPVSYTHLAFCRRNCPRGQTACDFEKRLDMDF